MNRENWSSIINGFIERECSQGDPASSRKTAERAMRTRDARINDAWQGWPRPSVRYANFASRRTSHSRQSSPHKSPIAGAFDQSGVGAEISVFTRL